jgi:hypothetical protein
VNHVRQVRRGQRITPLLLPQPRRTASAAAAGDGDGVRQRQRCRVGSGARDGRVTGGRGERCGESGGR